MGSNTRTAVSPRRLPGRFIHRKRRLRMGPEHLPRTGKGATAAAETISNLIFTGPLSWTADAACEGRTDLFFAPAGELIPLALEAVRWGGTVASAAIFWQLSPDESSAARATARTEADLTDAG